MHHYLQKVSLTDKLIALSSFHFFASILKAFKILSIYRSVLHNLRCESFLYEFPAEAIKQVEIEKPDIILTDLNVPDISGIDLTIALRKLFTKEQLPIIMVTTQNEANDNKSAYQAGINAIIHKPFNEESIGNVLTEFG